MDGVAVRQVSKNLLGGFTTGWEGTHSEARSEFNNAAFWSIDNRAEWNTLQYKNSSGNWLWFGGVVDDGDSDPYYDNKFWSDPTKHSVIRNSN